MPADPGLITAQLGTLLQDRDPVVRTTAAQNLGKLGAQTSVDMLVKALKDPEASVREASAWALGNMGEPAIPAAGFPLIERFADPSPAVRRVAAEAFGRLVHGTHPEPRLLEPIQEMLRHPDPSARVAAATALRWIEAASTYPTLIAMLKDPDARVRQEVVSALGELADRRALPVLATRLREDPDPGVRSEVAFRLGKVGDGTVRTALEAAARTDQDPGVKRWAQAALAHLGASVPQGG